MSDYVVTFGCDLYHHGIKGQKWGVRRFQRKDGSLTPAGKKRYDDSPGDARATLKKKSKHRTRLEEQYIASGMTRAQAEKAANKRIRTEKILAASAAVAVTACAAYIANKKIRERVDGVVKAGSKMQRIEIDGGTKLHDTFYAAKGSHDNTRYKNLLGSTRQKQFGQAFVMNLEAKSDIKVASQHNAREAFRKLWEQDADFRSSVQKHAVVNIHGGNKVDLSKLDNPSSRTMKKLYENFNTSLIRVRTDGGGADAKFYSALREKGYHAIQDINDMKFSGYKAKNPLIVFDHSKDSIMVKSVSKIDRDLQKAGNRELCKALTERSAEKLTPLFAAGLTAAAMTYRKESVTKQQARDSYRKAVSRRQAAENEFARASFRLSKTKNKSRYSAAKKKLNDAQVDEAIARARYKSASAKSASDASRIERKSYIRDMVRSGKPGGAADIRGSGRSTAIYNRLTIDKGKAYADSVVRDAERQTRRQTISTIATGATVATGMFAVSAILSKNT